MKLEELSIGDKFYPASKIGKATPIFKVLEDCNFNSGRGSSTRLCLRLDKNLHVSKSCRLEVIKSDTTEWRANY